MNSVVRAKIPLDESPEPKAEVERIIRWNIWDNLVGNTQIRKTEAL